MNKDWNALCVQHLMSISDSDALTVAMKRLLSDICVRCSASSVALLHRDKDNRVEVVQSVATDRSDFSCLAKLRWQPLDSNPAQDTIFQRPTQDDLLMDLGTESSGEAQMALLICGLGTPGPQLQSDLLAVRALIRMAISHIAESDRKKALASGPLAETIVDPGTRDRAVLRNAVERLTTAQALSVELIDGLLSAPHSGLDEAISDALGRMGGFCGSDRTYLFREIGNDLISNSHEWCAPGIEPMISLLQEQPLETAMPWYEIFEQQPEIYIEDVSKLPEDDPIRPVLEMQDIQSLLAVPLRHDGRIFGFVGYDAVREKRSFLKGEIALIRSVANVMATMLKRRDADIRLASIHAEKETQRKRLQATLNVIPDILLELDDGMRIVGYSANPSVARQVDLDAMVGLVLIDHFPADISEMAQSIRADLKLHDVVEGYEFSYTAGGQTRRYSVSAARSVDPETPEAPRYIAILRDVTEAHEQRKKIERLSLIAETTTNLVIVTDTAQRIEWVNSAFEARTGYKFDEIRGRKPGDFLQAPETDKQTLADIRAALKSLQPITCELLNVSRCGTRYWVRMTIQPVFDRSGAHEGFMAIQSDVTDVRNLMQDMEASLASEQTARIRLRSAVDSMQDALIMFDQDQRLVICNDPYKAIYPELADLLVPDAMREDLLRAGVRAGLFGVADADLESWIEHQSRFFKLRLSRYKLRHIAGRWYRETLQSTPDGGRICLMSDITEWKDAERRAVADRARAMDASRDGIALITAKGVISYLNAAGVRILRHDSPDALLGTDWKPLLLGDGTPELLAEIDAAFQREGFWKGETELASAPDTDPVALELSATRNEDDSILCIFRDITKRRRDAAEREKLREELVLARRREEIGLVAAGLAHDFNNLLAVISGASEMILDAEDVVSAQGLAARIAESSDQAAGLLRRMLALGKNSTVRVPVDLRSPLRDAEALIRPGLRAPISLSVRLPDHPVPTMADNTAVIQMVMNLIINARDALLEHKSSSADSRITLSLDLANGADLDHECDIGVINPEGRYAVIEVADTGPGMSKDVIDNIFTPYFSTKGDAGTGLGVPIVVNAVREQGGALKLQSKLGTGTCFTIFWPIETDAEPQGSDTGAEGYWRDKAVLVQSPDMERSEILTELLDSAGALSVPCASLAELKSLLQQDETWDALVLDLCNEADLNQARLAFPEPHDAALHPVVVAQGAVAEQAHADFAVCDLNIQDEDFLNALVSALQKHSKLDAAV